MTTTADDDAIVSADTTFIAAPQPQPPVAERRHDYCDGGGDVSVSPLSRRAVTEVVI